MSGPCHWRHFGRRCDRVCGSVAQPRIWGSRRGPRAPRLKLPGRGTRFCGSTPAASADALPAALFRDWEARPGLKPCILSRGLVAWMACEEGGRVLEAGAHGHGQKGERASAPVSVPGCGRLTREHAVQQHFLPALKAESARLWAGGGGGKVPGAPWRKPTGEDGSHSIPNKQRHGRLVTSCLTRFLPVGLRP